MKVAIIAEWVVHFFCNVATYIPAWTTNYLILVENVIFSRYREGLSLSVKVLLLEISLRLYSVFLILVLRVIIHWISVYSNYTNTRLQWCWYIYICTYNSHWSWWSDRTGCCRVAVFSVGLGRFGTRPAPLVCWRPRWWLFCLTPGCLDCSLSGSWPVGSEVAPLWKRIAHVLPLVCCSVRNLKK